MGICIKNTYKCISLLFINMWTPGPSFPLGTSQCYSYTHADNSLRVLLCPVAGAKACAYMRAVQAGSKDEDLMGAAHFIEHMSFRIQKGKIWTLASKGDVINAETNMDSTRFYVVHMPHQTAQTIEIDANRFKQAAVPADKVPVERHAVQNELERGEQAGNKMFRTTSAVAILEHPYHHSTIGTAHDVAAATADDMEHFRAKYYVPNNTTLIFAGAFEPQAVLDTVHQHFGAIPPGAHCHTDHSPEPAQLGQRSVEMHLQAPCGMVCMAFRQPRGNTKEALALQCISRLLWQNGEGRAKPLITKGVLHDVSTYAPRQLDPYLWFFHGTLSHTDHEIRQDTEAQMLATLQSLVTHPVTEQELHAVKNSMTDDWHRGTESVTEMMNELGRGVSMGNWQDFAARHATLAQITPQDIQHVAQCTFARHNLTVTHVIPTEKPLATLQPTAMAAGTVSTSPAASAIPMADGTHSDWSVVQLSPLTHVLHVPRANYVRVTLSARFSPQDHDIASLFVSNMGNGCKMSASATSTLMAMHTERNFTHDHEFVHMTMAMPCRSTILSKASDLMFNGEWKQPTFSSSFLELQKRHMLAELHAKHQDQKFLMKRHLMRALFTNTPYDDSLDVRATRIRQCSLARIRQFHQTCLLSPSVYVTMVTPTTDAASALGKVFPAHTETTASTLSWRARPRQAATRETVLPGYGSFQVALGQTVATTPHTAEHTALACAINILGGGMTGRLMHTVREEKGLGTYGLYASMQVISAQTTPLFCVSGTFSPASVHEGMACTRALVQEWHAHGVTEAELADAKDRMIGRQQIGADTVDNLHQMVLGAILDGRAPKAAFEAHAARIRALTLDDVNQAITKYVDPSKLVSVSVGPETIRPYK